MNYHHISHESHLPASGHPISYTSPPQGFLPPPPGYQGYFYEGYPPSQPGLAPSQPYLHHEHYNDHDSGCSSILRGCLAALCCFCVLEECCF